MAFARCHAAASSLSDRIVARKQWREGSVNHIEFDGRKAPAAVKYKVTGLGVPHDVDKAV